MERRLVALAEALHIRVLLVLDAIKPDKRPGLCPPKCSESHTYRWPCRARIRTINRPKKKAINYRRLN